MVQKLLLWVVAQDGSAIDAGLAIRRTMLQYGHFAALTVFFAAVVFTSDSSYDVDRGQLIFSLFWLCVAYSVVDFVVVAFDKQRRTLHDMFVSTVVARP